MACLRCNFDHPYFPKKFSSETEYCRFWYKEGIECMVDECLREHTEGFFDTMHMLCDNMPNGWRYSLNGAVAVIERIEDNLFIESLLPVAVSGNDGNIRVNRNGRAYSQEMMRSGISADLMAKISQPTTKGIIITATSTFNPPRGRQQEGRMRGFGNLVYLDEITEAPQDAVLPFTREPDPDDVFITESVLEPKKKLPHFRKKNKFPWS